ncbi:hypothetical protein GCM10023176_07890 [Micromonospora coerulea]|uniref:Uncharacterized protein n=1 Tax=Micromonospora coerulea TaxID=47856 RepID=A0ABP8S719_9ACTN
MRDDIVLRLDRATAEDLYVALYEAGEHIAAGAAITPPTAEEAAPGHSSAGPGPRPWPSWLSVLRPPLVGRGSRVLSGRCGYLIKVSAGWGAPESLR